MKLRPPHPEHERFKHRLEKTKTVPRRPVPESWARTVKRKAKEISWFAVWLGAKRSVLFPPGNRRDRFAMKVESFRKVPRYAERLGGWRLSGEPTDGGIRLVLRTFAQAADLPPVFEDALDSTVFALRQFKERTMRDGAGLAILATDLTALKHPRIFDLMSEMAAASDIPAIDQADYILRLGAEPEDAHWRHDAHWNVAGHRWAAEALLEWLKDN